MQKLEALKMLEAKSASIEQEYGTDTHGTPKHFDARAAAKALAAVFDFLRDCKIPHRASLLRVLEHYLRKPKGGTGPVQGPRNTEILKASAIGLKANRAARWMANRLGQKRKPSGGTARDLP